MTIQRLFPVFALGLLCAACADRGAPAVLDHGVGATDTAVAKAECARLEDAGSPEQRLAAHVKAMKKELGEGFVVKGRFPFAVAGDMPQSQLDRYMEHTIFGSLNAFEVQFFRTMPSKILRVYLFGSSVSYHETAYRLWGDRNLSKYGYYVPSRRALIMNIRTGGGTLVHELVHACTDVDFPDIPKWFDEGMASLFEQCTIRYNRILGLENWRLPILKKGLTEGRALPLRKLMATTRAQFLDAETSLHYAQARYFCMYVQEQGQLETYYRAYRDRFKEDPTGVRFVEEIFEKPLEEVEKDMLAWVQTIRFR